MRLLADENLPKAIVDMLRAAGCDVLWARVDCPAWRDVVLLDFAESQGRILLTLDKDFWQIAVQRRLPLKQSGIVLFRIHPATAETLRPLARAILELDRPWAGHISIVGLDGIQMLPAASS